jgi:hypothetical protein
MMPGENTVFLLGTAVLALLLVRALAGIMANSLRVLAVAVTGFGLLANEAVTVETGIGEMHPIQAGFAALLDGMALPVPEFTEGFGEVMWGSILSDPVTGGVAATHFLAGVLIVILTMGLLESSWLLGLLGGLFGTGFVLWTDYWWVINVEYITVEEFAVWTFVAGASGALGVVLSLLVVEPVFQSERGGGGVDDDESDVDAESVLEELRI